MSETRDTKQRASGGQNAGKRKGGRPGLLVMENRLDADGVLRRAWFFRRRRVPESRIHPRGTHVALFTGADGEVTPPIWFLPPQAFARECWHVPGRHSFVHVRDVDEAERIWLEKKTAPKSWPRVVRGPEVEGGER